MTQANPLLKILLPVAMAMLGICFYNLAITGFDLACVPGDSGDARFINYILEHGYQHLNGHHAFWDAPFMYPQQNTLAFSDNMMGTLPVYGFFRLLGNDRETAYQLWWITMSLLNFTTCYLVLCRMVQNPVVAALGAFIFAFGLFNQSQMSYLQMNIRFAVPFVFYYAWQMVVRPSIKNHLFFSLWLLIQFYAVIYTGILVFYLSFCFMAVVALVHRKWNFVRFYLEKKHLVKTMAIGLLTILALYVLLKPYIDVSKITGLRLFSEVVPTLPCFGAWFFAHDSSWAWKFLTHHLKHEPNWFLFNIFPGLLPMLGFATGGAVLLYQRIKNQPLPKLWLALFIVAGLVFLLFTRTSNGYTLYALIFKLPGMNSLRVLSRIMHVQLFFLVALLSVSMVFFLRRTGKKGFYALGIVFFMAVMADNAFDAGLSLRTPKKELQQRVAEVTAKIKKQLQPKHRVLALVAGPGKTKAYLTHLDAMLAAQELHIPCINAYTSYCPDDYGPFFVSPKMETLEQWMMKRKIDRTKILVMEAER